MKFYFWQNIISPHQIDFLVELSKKNKVTLIVGNVIDPYRSKQNWNVSVPSNIELIVAPTNKQILALIKQSKLSDQHIISGFIAYRLPNIALILCALLKRNVFIYSESVDWFSVKGYSKLVTRYLIGLPLKSRISGVFAIGEKGTKYFEKLGFTKDKIFEFGYFVSPFNSYAIKKKPPRKSILFVGRLVKCKGILEFLPIFSALEKKDNNFDLKIIGDGEQKSAIKSQINLLGIKNIEMLGDIPRDQVFRYMVSSDYIMKLGSYGMVDHH